MSSNCVEHVMKYFVTGGTGFIGSHLIRRLVDQDHEVIAIARTPESAPTSPEAVNIVQGDVTDKESMREAMTGCDRVFHVAGWYQVGVDDPTTAFRVNVEGTRNVLELMAELDIERGVYTSTVAVFSDTDSNVVDESYRYDGPHLSIYDRTKWQAHYEVAEPMIEAGLPLVIVQPGAVYGPGDRGPIWALWKAYLQEDLPFVPRRAGYCFGHVEDTVDGHLLAMDDGTIGEAYVIAGEPYSLVEVFELAEEITGINAPRSISPIVFRALSRLVEPLERAYRFPAEYSSETLRILGGVTYWADNSKASQALGLDHRPFRDGLGETLEAEVASLEG